MSKERPESNNKQLDLYYSSKQADVKYEVVKRPLQDYVSIARKTVCLGWSKMRSTVQSSVSTARHKTEDQLVSLGIKHPVRVIQAGAVGTAALLGLIVARNKSLFRRILYPVLTGGTAWGVVHFSEYKKKMRSAFSENFDREFSKHFPQEFSKHFPREYWKHLPQEMREEMEKYRQSDSNNKSEEPKKKDD